MILTCGQGLKYVMTGTACDILCMMTEAVCDGRKQRDMLTRVSLCKCTNSGQLTQPCSLARLYTVSCSTMINIILYLPILTSLRKQ